MTTLERRSFRDARGWRTSRWRTEADFEALIVWNLSADWLGGDAQPCLVAGHLNWLCLNFFGSSLPSVSWAESQPSDERTTSKRKAAEDALWRSVSSSLFGCRSWIKARIEAGDRFPYERSVLPELGMIANEALLKATLVAQYLVEGGRLGALVQATHGREDRVVALEQGLGQSLPELDEDWTRWLMGEDIAPGLVQRLGGAAEVEVAADPRAAKLLASLRGLRAQAFRGMTAYTWDPELIAELNQMATAHAEYLVLNPEQLAAWPDAHEEYPDHEGFTALGAQAGSRSVIHSVADPVAALDGWMGTFFHRLPLLAPGLFGVGYGGVDNVTVLDTNSLVVPYYDDLRVLWPAAGATGVPRSFQPELPNPVPGEQQSEWGYPITLQAYYRSEERELDFQMQLFLGAEPGGEPVDCHYLTPTTPAFKLLAPRDAFCLIPKHRLKAKSTYSVEALCVETGERTSWSFTTGR